MPADSFLIVIKHHHCPQCGWSTRHGGTALGADGVSAWPELELEARVTSIEAIDGAWLASGQLKFFDTGCACGTALRAIMRQVPIQCDGFECPNCHSSEHLSYKVRKIDNDALEFNIAIECFKCKRKRSLSRILKRLFSLAKISVGPIGISAKTETTKDE